MAPELHSDATHYDGKSCDIFSLGVCLFNIVTGLPPFAEATVKDPWYKRLVSKPHKFFTRFYSHTGIMITAECQDLIAQMLAVLPSDRPSIEEVLESDFFFNVNYNVDVTRELLKAAWEPQPQQNE